MKNRKMRISVLINALWLTTLIFQPVTLAKGRVEHHLMISRILADAGQPGDRELSVYLPEEYDTLGLAYPVVYAIHGGSANDDPVLQSNRLWFAFGDPIPWWDDVPKPLIIVLPSMGRTSRVFETEAAYLIEEIMPFVEGTYRTLPYREGRAIDGLSRGGVDAFYIALSHPELFSVVGGISAGSFNRTPPVRKLLEAHDQEIYPFQFWLAYGLNEGNMTMQNRDLVKALEELGFPHAYVEDDSGHFDVGAINQRGFWVLKSISETLSGGVVSVELLDGIPTAWGYIKDQY